MRIRHLILLLLVPLSEIKSIFYASNIKVSWYLFADEKKHLCNVLENYSNMIIIGVVFYFITFLKLDIITKKICLFLFIINLLDFAFIGLMGNALYLLKIPLAILTYNYYACRLQNGFLTH